MARRADHTSGWMCRGGCRRFRWCPPLWHLPTRSIAVYRANARVYSDQLVALDAYAKTAATIPEDRRVLITAHDAFQYMGRAYEIEVRGIQGISTESSGGP